MPQRLSDEQVQALLVSDRGDEWCWVEDALLDLLDARAEIARLEKLHDLECRNVNIAEERSAGLGLSLKHSCERISELEAENARLRVEVERLRGKVMDLNAEIEAKDDAAWGRSELKGDQP